MFWLDNGLASNQEKSNYLIDCNIKKQKTVKQKHVVQVARAPNIVGLCV